jgi:hypothetical protein
LNLEIQEDNFAVPKLSRSLCPISHPDDFEFGFLQVLQILLGEIGLLDGNVIIGFLRQQALQLVIDRITENDVVRRHRLDVQH